MSSKIAKKMMATVDEMVARASTAITRADQPKSKRKAAKRALTGSISKRGAQGLTSGAASAKSGSVSKRRGRRKVGLLEQARRELRGASRADKNIRLLSYSRKPGQAGTKKVKSKTQKAVERLLDVDVKEGAKSRKG